MIIILNLISFNGFGIDVIVVFFFFFFFSFNCESRMGSVPELIRGVDNGEL